MDLNINAPCIDKFSEALNNLAKAIAAIGSPKTEIERALGPLNSAATATRAAVKPVPAPAQISPQAPLPMVPTQLPPQPLKAPIAQYPPAQAPAYPQTTSIRPGAASIPINQLPNGVPGGARAYAQQVNAMIPPTAPPIQQVPTAAPPAYAIEDLARAASSLMDAGKQQQLLDLLQQYGIQQLDRLPKERYGEFATALRGLGARI